MGADLEVPKGEGRMTLAFNYATRGFDQMTASMAIGGVDQGLPNCASNPALPAERRGLHAQ